MHSFSNTMIAAFAARSKLFSGDLMACARKILKMIPEAKVSRDEFDKQSRNMFSRSIQLREVFFREAILQNINHFKQILFLSAGMDFKPFDKKLLASKKVFSVDHVNSQNFLMSLLNKIQFDLSGINFVDQDLNRVESLLAKLSAKGFDPELETLIVWEGSTYYFSTDAVFDVLKKLCFSIKNATFLIDFINVHGYFDNAGNQAPVMEQVNKYLNKLQEPWIGYFDPNEVLEFFLNNNFQKVEIQDRSEIERKYLKDVLMGDNRMFFLNANRKEHNNGQ